jgi:hypothetical protein
MGQLQRRASSTKHAQSDDPGGGEVWQDDPATMQIALAEWVDTSRPVCVSTGQLPPWPANAEYSMSGDFAFYVGEGIDREAYDALRRRDIPASCYVQTIERLNCLAFDDESGALISVGVKTISG